MTERVLGVKSLSGENEELFHTIWNWLVDQGITTKEQPQVGSDAGNYHNDGVIGINEKHCDETFPLGAVMLEEALHYVLSSDDPRSSADFSPEFLHSLVRIITVQLAGATVAEKRKFQSTLILCLWGLIQRQPG